MSRRGIGIGIGLILSLASGSVATSQPVPVRLLGPVVRVSAPNELGSVSAIRILSDGRVIVNDIRRRQLLLFDSTLMKIGIIADSTGNLDVAYRSRSAGIIPYRSDSTLFVDPVALGMLVIDPSAHVARVMAVPRPQDAMFLVGGPSGSPMFDSAWRLVHRGTASPVVPKSTFPVIQLPIAPDSAPLVRIDIPTRRLDTLTSYRVFKVESKIDLTASGAINVTTTINPLQPVDDWAVSANGEIAILRGRDYHIDWVHPDGTTSSTSKIPFDWERMTDSSKRAVLDSSKVVFEKELKEAMPALAAIGGRGNASVPPGMGLVTMPEPTELPDYRPAFNAGAMHADLGGNLWIRTTKVANGGSVYDVVDRSGRLVDRILVPRGRVVVGFGAGDIVYTGVLDGDGARLEKFRSR